MDINALIITATKTGSLGLLEWSVWKTEEFNRNMVVVDQTPQLVQVWDWNKTQKIVSWWIQIDGSIADQHFQE